MSKKKTPLSPNYLEKIPSAAEGMPWKADDKHKVTLEISNTGFFNRMAQKFLRRPPVTYIHLDELGSFVWLRMNGQRDILSLAQDVKEEFGEKAEPLYGRLAKYFQILDSYHFIKWVERDK